MGFFDPNEMAALEQQAVGLRQRQEAQVTGALTGPQVQALAKAYPHVSPYVTVPLAASGVTPESEVAKRVAQAQVPAKAKRGLGWHSIGDVVTGGYAVAKGAVRGAFMGFDALPQAIQGEFRNNLADDGRISLGEALGVLNPLNLDFAQTDAGAGLSQIRERGLSGLDYGSGFFAGGQVKAEQVRRARAAAPLINGRAATVGRYYAAKVFDAGSKPYNILSGLVDASVQLDADLSNYVAAPIKGAIKSSRLLTGDASKRFVRSGKQIVVESKTGAVVGGGEANALARAEQQRLTELAGGVQGALRNTVLPDRVSEWLLSRGGQRTVEHIANTDSYTQLRRMFKGRIESDTLVRLTDAKTPQEVYNVLGPELGVTIRQKPSAPRAATMLVRQTLDNVRLAGMVPGSHVDLHNADDAVEQLDRMLLNFKAPAETRHALVERMARAGSPNARFGVLKEALDGRQGALRALGLDGETANRLTRMFTDYTTDGARYAVNEIGENMIVPGVVLDGAGKALPTPHLLGEYIGRAVPLPDARAVRAATSQLGRMIDATPGLRPAVSALDYVSQQMFKPLVLLRGAWTLRVVGEEQVRLAGSGKSSLLSHPISHIALMTGRNLSTGLTGDVLADTDEAIKALSKGSNNLLEQGGRQPNRISTGRKRLYERGLPGYTRAWSDELAELNADPLARRLANGALLAGDRTPNPAAGIDGIRDWFINGVGRKFRLEMADAPDRKFLLTEKGANDYIDSVIDRIRVKTGGDVDLHRIIATGQFNGHQVFDASLSASRKARRASRDFIAELERRALNQQGPVMVKGDDFLSVKMKAGSAFTQAKDRAFEVLFGALMSTPTNILSRSPAFKQFYWERSQELVGFMSPEAQKAAIQAAKDANLSPKVIQRMEATAYKRSGTLTLDDADVLAKGHGLDATRKLLYDLHERSQFFDINRNLFPFGEAWKEVLTTWANVGVQNPMIVRRAGQIVSGARNADIDGDGRGIFYPDPLTGEEMIAFPFSEEFTGLVTGVPVKMQGTAKGLNVFSQSVLPGFGPVVQIAAGRLLPDDPTFDGVRNALIPFGETDTSGGVFESFLPAWLKKFQTSGWVVPDRRGKKQERAYMNTVTDVMRYLLSTGEYSISTRQEQDRLVQDAKRKASVVYVLRGLTQFFAPTAPSTEFVAKDKDGRAQLTFQLAKEYRALQEEDYKTATARFIDKFGENAFLSTISKTTGGGATTKPALDFARRHPEVERQFRDVFALFASPSDEFDLGAYQRQLDSGQREVRTPQEAIDLANQRIATMIYARAKEKVGDNPDAQGRQFLREIKDKLVEQYPGYSSSPMDLGKTDRLVEQLLAASKNKVLAQTDAGKGLVVYAKARAKAVDAARELGLESFSRSPKAVGIRNWLRNISDAVTERHPEFATMFDQVLVRELGDDERGVSNG